MGFSNKKLDNFKFVIAKKHEGSWKFIKYAPEEFMKFNTIPPFKTYFNISLDGKNLKEQNKNSKSIRLTKENLDRMEKFWNSLTN